MENLAGYLASGLIGVLLGLIGGGGSIITIPMLVYLFHIEPTLATAYSLFIVGTTSLVGGVRSAFHKRVDFNSVILFAIPSTTGVYITRHYLLPHLPDTLIALNGFVVTRDNALMLFFALIMGIASVKMIRNRQDDNHTNVGKHHFATIVIHGVLVGVVTGIAGAGGGFLIIPTLVLLVGLSMKRAIGTSLIIIAINSLIGFIGDVNMLREIDVPFLLLLSSLAIAGIFLGTYMAGFINGKRLKAGFGWFALTMAVFMVIKEVMK